MSAYLRFSAGNLRELSQFATPGKNSTDFSGKRGWTPGARLETAKPTDCPVRLEVKDASVNIQVVILAGGQGTRLGEVTKGRPKSMVLVRGRPFLEYQLELLKAQGIRDVVLCIGHLGEQIGRYFGNGERIGLDIRYNLEDRPLGTAGALKNAASLLNDTFFTMYGDSYLFLDFRHVMSYFQSQKKLALMTVYRNHDYYDRSNAATQGNLVKKYSKQERTPDMVYIDYGANIFRKEVLSLVPEDQPYRLEELFPRLIERGELLAFEVRERFYEIGSLQGLRDFKKYVGGQDDTLQSTDQDNSRRRRHRP